MTKVTADISGTGQFTDPIKTYGWKLKEHVKQLKGYLMLTVFEGSWDATIELQKSDDGFVNHIVTVDTFQASDSLSLFDIDPEMEYRVGIPSGGTYTSGPVPVKLAKK